MCTSKAHTIVSLYVRFSHPSDITNMLMYALLCKTFALWRKFELKWEYFTRKCIGKSHIFKFFLKKQQHYYEDEIAIRDYLIPNHSKTSPYNSPQTILPMSVKKNMNL